MKCQQCGKEYPHKKGRFCGYCYPPKPEKDGLKLAINALIQIADTGEHYGMGRCECNRCTACLAQKHNSTAYQTGGEGMSKRKMIDYKENIRYSCGCVREVVTLQKLLRRQVAVMRQNECPKCQLIRVMRVELNKNPTKNPRPLIDEYDEQR